MRTTVLSVCALAALVSTAAGQASRFVGKQECGKPGSDHSLNVADSAKHVLSIGEVKCTWSEGTIGGERLKDEQDSYISDADGNSSTDRGYGVGTLANGDQYYVHFKGESKIKDGHPISSECTWKFTGGTGKLNGIKGKGTCKGTFQSDGKATWEMKGDYVLKAAPS